jgi:hypothetical protein
MKLPWGLRWWELLPEVVLGLALGVFLVTETSAATSAFESTTAIVLMVLTGASWLTARIVLVRYARWPALRLAVFAVAGLKVLTVVVLPAYDDTTVVETLTVPAAAVGAGGDEPPNRTAAADPPLPLQPPLQPPHPLPSEPRRPLPPEPVALRSSPVGGIDHRASGTAVLYRQSDGSQVVGLEDIDIQPGPDYDVYVVAGAGREDVDGGTRLDDLRGNKGTQYYPVPTGVDVATGQWTVLVWCQTFDVPVAGATLA